jgi:hypothetical protein
MRPKCDPFSASGGEQDMSELPVIGSHRHTLFPSFKRRGRDLNPRPSFHRVRDFQSRSLGHSDTSPRPVHGIRVSGSGFRAKRQASPTKEESPAATRSQEGLEAGPPVRAHQGERQGAGRFSRPRRGDRCTDREQGARALRRVENACAHVHAGHVLGPPRRASLRDEPPQGPHEGPALRRGEEARDRGAVEDEQAPAPAGDLRQEELASATSGDARRIARSPRSSGTTVPAAPARRPATRSSRAPSSPAGRGRRR